MGFNWLLSQCKVCNQLPVIKLSASATIRDVIGQFREIDLTLAGSSLVVVVANALRTRWLSAVPKQLTSLPWYDFDCCGTGKRKTL